MSDLLYINILSQSLMLMLQRFFHIFLFTIYSCWFVLLWWGSLYVALVALELSMQTRLALN